MIKLYSPFRKAINIIFLGLSILISFQTNAQSCLDFSVGAGQDPYMFIDFFKTSGEWKISGSSNDLGTAALSDRYKITGLDQFKIVNNAYQYLNPSSTSGNCNAIHFWDMMVDQGKVLPSGYPVSIPLTIHPYKAKSADPLQAVDSSKAIKINSISRTITNIPEGAPFSGWILRWKGKGTFTIDGLSDVVMNTGTKSLRGASSGSGSTYAFSSAVIGAGKATVSYNYYLNDYGRQLTIESSDVSDPIREIQFIYPGMEAILDGGQNINPKFIEKVSKYKVVRYMDYMHANSVTERPFVTKDNPYYTSHFLKGLTWSERTPKEWYKVNATHEYIIEISNLSKTSPWVNIPYAAGQDYVENMAKFYIEKLASNLQLYVEVGNENWNWGGGGYNDDLCSWQPGFNSFYYFAAYGDQYYPGIGQDLSTGKRINELYKWLTAAAGSSKGKLQRVLSGQTNYPSLTEQLIAQVENQNWDALAIYWYFGLATDTLSNSCKNRRAELYNYWQNNQSNQSDFNKKYKETVLADFRCRPNYIRENSYFAKSANKKLVTYGGGSDVVGSAANGPYGNPLQGEFVLSGEKYPQYLLDNDFVYSLIMADRSEESGEIINEIIDTLKANNVSLINYYGLSSRPTAWGIWSLFDQSDMDENLETLNAKYPKYKAFNERAHLEQNCILTETSLQQNNSANEILGQNIPNPAMNRTSIPFSISKEEFIKIELVNGQGQIIRTLLNEQRVPGYYFIEVDLTNLPEGLYYYKLSGPTTETKKMIVIR